MRNFIFLSKFNVPKERRANEAATDTENMGENGKGGEQGACGSHLMFVGALRDTFSVNFLYGSFQYFKLKKTIEYIRANFIAKSLF